MRIKDELGAEVAYSEQVAASDFEEVFRGYAMEGYNLIFGHGFQFGEPALKVAPEFPDTKFIITSTNITQEPNVGSILNDSLQQGFLAGVVAGLMTESNYVGSVGGMEIPSIIAFQEGFLLGVKYVNPEAKAVIPYTGNFYDAAQAKEMAIAMINEGADIITHDADKAGLGVIEAGKEYGIPTIGAIGDQHSLSPETVVTSALNDMAMALVTVAKLVQEGKFSPKNYVMGVAEGCVGLAPYYSWEDKLDKEIKDKIAQIVKDIETGKLDVSSLK